MSLTPQRLKRLVKYRERLERLQEQQLGKASAVRAERAEALELVQQEKSAYLVGGRATGILDITQLVANQAYSARLDRLQSARSAALRVSDQQVDRERQTLLSRSRDRKAMERLLERRVEEARLLTRREEAKLLDEAAIARWAPQNTASPGSAGNLASSSSAGNRYQQPAQRAGKELPHEPHR